MLLDTESIRISFCLWSSVEHDTSQMLKTKITSTQYVQGLFNTSSTTVSRSTEARTSGLFPGFLGDAIHRHHSQQERAKSKTVGRESHADQHISNKKRRSRLPPQNMSSGDPSLQEAVSDFVSPL
jgi:hypothetical protein